MFDEIDALKHAVEEARHGHVEGCVCGHEHHSHRDVGGCMVIVHGLGQRCPCLVYVNDPNFKLKDE